MGPESLTVDLVSLLQTAWELRAALRERLLQENTDCYRIFHGVSEGCPGITLDRYGPVAWMQCSGPATQGLDFPELERWATEVAGCSWFVALQRGKQARVLYRSLELPPHVSVREFGLEYGVTATPRGLDADLFLDTRALRRRLLQGGFGKVLNLFSATCSLGLAAEKGGATDVWNVDFSHTALAIGKANEQKNGLSHQKYVCQEVYPVTRQLSGQSVNTRARQRQDYQRFQAERFDLVILDPPPLSRGHYATVDVVRDYQGLFRPCLEISPCIVACNNLSSVEYEDFLTMLQRCAKKWGKKVEKAERIWPEEDFPSHDGRPPLKMVEMVVA